MRIISIIVVLYLVYVMVFPQYAAAGETINTNTKIEFQINSDTNKFIAFQPKVDESYLKTQEEATNEKILAKWESKRNSANLPKDKFTINASAYTAAADECGKSDGITASGIKVKENRTLACPPAYPFGTKIQIDGVGTLVCEDRGGAIKGNHFDIYMKTKKEAFAFGRKNLSAEVVE